MNKQEMQVENGFKLQKEANNYTKKANNIKNTLKAYNNAKNQSNRYSSINGTRKVANSRSFTQRLFGSPTKLYKNSSFSRNAKLARENRNKALKNATTRKANVRPQNINIFKNKAINAQRRANNSLRNVELTRIARNKVLLNEKKEFELGKAYLEKRRNAER